MAMIINEEFIEHAIAKAVRGESKLTDEILGMKGFSPRRLRHLLNNLMFDGAIYLEIGVMWGAAFVAALFGHSICHGYGFDNYSQFDATEAAMRQYIGKHLAGYPTDIYIIDCFMFKVPTEHSVDVYFYDGSHDEDDQRRAITHFKPWLKERFILVIDDWNWPQVSKGTQRGIVESGFRIERSWLLGPGNESDAENWWNGVMVALVNQYER